jgi:hypothetical protein
MSDLMWEVSHCGGPLSDAAWRQPVRTAGKTAGKTDDKRPFAGGSLDNSRQAVAEALTAAGFLGFSTSRRDALRRFAQCTGGVGTADVSVTINWVRAALLEHGFCGLTSSGMDKIKAFLVPDKPPMDAPADTTDSAATRAATEAAAQTAGQVQDQPEMAEAAQANVTGDAAVKLLT